MRISDWSSDVCSSDLRVCDAELVDSIYYSIFPNISPWGCYNPIFYRFRPDGDNPEQCIHEIMFMLPVPKGQDRPKPASIHRSEEHTSELQSLMRISYAVFCLKKKTSTH